MCCVIRQLVAEHYPWFLETYDALPKNIMRADAVRHWELSGSCLHTGQTSNPSCLGGVQINVSLASNASK